MLGKVYRNGMLLAAVVVALVPGIADAAYMHDPAVTPPEDYIAHGDSFPGTGFMTAQTPDGGNLWGSLVLVSPCQVMTAAHNVWLWGYDQPNTDFTVGFGSDIDDDPGALYNVIDYDLVPGYRWDLGYGQSPDIAVLTLDRDVLGLSPRDIFRGTDQLGEILSIVGYGIPGTVSGGFQDPDYRRRGGTDIANEFGSPFWPDYFYTADFAAPGHPYFQDLGMMVTPGDSGGPWFNDAGEVVGITSFRSGSYGYSGESGATRVSLYSGWIDSVLVPEPASGVLMLAAAVSFVRVRRRSA